jgi:hypothetical protein
MDPKFLMEAMQSSVAGGGVESMGLDEAGMKNMMEMLETVQKDPAMMKQMEGMWKMMDEMHQNNPDEYRKYVDKNMTEMKAHHVEEKKVEDKKHTINSQSYFCFSVRPSKVSTAPPKKQADPDVKLFDF